MRITYGLHTFQKTLALLNSLVKKSQGHFTTKIRTLMKKILIWGIPLVIVLIQFVPVNRNNPEVIAAESITSQLTGQPEVEKILRNACFDCHSNESKYPWYSYVAPASWFIQDHINEGREELNFSIWNTYSEKRKDHKLEETIELVEKRIMPMESYLILHSEAKLTSEQIQLLGDWVSAERGKMGSTSKTGHDEEHEEHDDD